MTEPRRTPAMGDIGQDEAETFANAGRMAALREWRDGEAPAKPNPANVAA
jgi:hypothetical protein